MAAEIESIVGRYLHMHLGGRPYRVYFEEAGKGIPLVCLHTAGSDTRQYRHLMTDPAVTEHYRVLAFDMPWHGKSNPPPGWHEEEYRLTTETYLEAIMGFCRALELNPSEAAKRLGVSGKALRLTTEKAPLDGHRTGLFLWAQMDSALQFPPVGGNYCWQPLDFRLDCRLVVC